jgi:hypothetical protein
VAPLADGDLLLEESGGGSRTATLKLHVPYSRREGVDHNVINANPFDFACIDIEHLLGYVLSLEWAGRQGRKCAPRPRPSGIVAASGDDVRGQLVFEPGELVAQQKLAFLEPLQLELVGLTGVAQRLDRRVEVAVLLAQPLDLSDEGGAFLRREPLVIHPYATLFTHPVTMEAPRRLRKAFHRFLTRRQGAAAYYEIVKIFSMLRSVAACPP